MNTPTHSPIRHQQKAYDATALIIIAALFVALMIVATVVALAAIVLTIVVVLAVVVVPLALMARQLTAAISLLLPLTPSAFARQLLLLKRKENKHVAT